MILCVLHIIPLDITKYNNISTQNEASSHGLQTPNEGINQRYLKKCADVADKICFGLT